LKIEEDSKIQAARVLNEEVERTGDPGKAGENKGIFLGFIA
jgi:hypothetical protein